MEAKSGLVILVVLAALPALGLSEPPATTKFSVEIGPEILSGFSQYELVFVDTVIDGEPLSGHSRLKFPVSSNLYGGQIRFSYDQLAGRIGYWSSFSHRDAGEMEDFDWLTYADERMEVAYGMAHNSFGKVNKFKAELAWLFRLGIVQLGPYARYTIYSFDYNLEDLTQFWYVADDGSPLFPPAQFDTAGPVLDYELDLTMPVGGAAVSIAASRALELDAELGYTPWIKVKDTDHHLLRNLHAHNTGSGGHALDVEIGGKLAIYRGLQLGLALGYQEYVVETVGFQEMRDVEPPTVFTGLDTQVRGVIRHARLTLSYPLGP